MTRHFRSLGKTILVKMLVKKNVSQLEKDKKTPEEEIKDEINCQVRKWGIDVHSVRLSEAKVLKQPDSSGNSAVGSILKGLGMKGDTPYPTPQEFARAAHGFGEQQQNAMSTAGPALFQSLLGGFGPQSDPAAAGPGVQSVASPADWGQCLDAIIRSEFGSTIDGDAHGLYCLEITQKHEGKETYYIELSDAIRVVTRENLTGRKPDVWVTISHQDLANVLDGSLAPLQAYLTGRISAAGDVRKLMFFDKLSNRGHKPGTTFTA